MNAPHVDVLILGAGISGIGMACHLTQECPDLTFTVLERRERVGGTWDLFRYPGIRSDSDMYTFGFTFRPWLGNRVLADGTSIRTYVKETADEYGVSDRIVFHRKVVRADFSTETSRWSVETLDESTGETHTYTANFLVAGTGYYDYDQGYRPTWPGEERFGGTVVHPQKWPEDLDYAGKRVLIIGSGATAVTLVPAMAETAAHVTMLQRSPSYILSLPAVDKISAALRKVLPDGPVYRLARWRNIAIQRTMFRLARRKPDFVRKVIQNAAAKQLAGNPTGTTVADFTPRYNPWDQRLCVVPDGDLFKTIREGRAEVVTDTIDTWTEKGVRTTSGREIEADVIVTATGLNVQLLGGAELAVDGTPVDVKDAMIYKAVMLSGVPNAAFVLGYINASWTLKADLTSAYVCRLLNHMRAHGYTQVVAHADESAAGDGTVFGALDSGYVRRGADKMPRQGTSGPWLVTHDFLKDVPLLRRGPIEDDVVEFRSSGSRSSTTAEVPAATP